MILKRTAKKNPLAINSCVVAWGPSGTTRETNATVERVEPRCAVSTSDGQALVTGLPRC